MDGIGDEPLHVNHDVFPAERLQILCHPLRVDFYLGFIHGRPVGIPAIPPHRRRGSGQACVLRAPRQFYRQKQCNSDHASGDDVACIRYEPYFPSRLTSIQHFAVIQKIVKTRNTDLALRNLLVQFR